MPIVIQRNVRNVLSGFQNYLSAMPRPLFIVMFLLSACYLLLTKIEANDLWWHLACGRYFFEHGSYPPPGTFSFSPASQSTANSQTWLGDVVLYGIHHFFGGEIGLQVFGIIVSCIPVWVFTRFTTNRYNTWILLGSLIIVMGTYQQNLLRNSIFAMVFLPLMVWLWHIAIKERNFKWLLFYPAILLLWSHMHGYVIVGVCILSLFFVGEVIDQSIKKENRNIRFLLVLMIVTGCSWGIVQVNWNINPIGILRNIQTALLQDSTPKELSLKTIAEKPENSQTDKLIDETSASPHRIIHFVQALFRPFLKGGDAEIVNEYVSPFEAYAILPVKTLFMFSFCYLIYLFLGLYYDRGGLRGSYVLPSLGSLFLGLGYVRTVAFPFLIALPLMAAHLPAVLKCFREDKNSFVTFIRDGMPWIGLILFIALIFSFYPEALPGRFLAVFLIIPAFCLGVLWLKPDTGYQGYFSFNRFLFWLLPFVICIQFALTAHYHYKEKTFYKLTQILTREPGIGRNSLFRDTLPDYVLKNYRTEKLLNSYSMGGFLIWKWYNEKKVFIDSRSIDYKKDFYDDYNNNYSFKYIDSLGIDKALLNITVDEARYHAYMSHDWTLLSFDISTILLQRKTKAGLQSNYGIIPDYLGKPEDIDLLPKPELHTFGAFINNTLRYMLLFGRLADAIQWTENIQSLMGKLPLNMQQGIRQKKEFMSMLERHFGRINDPVIAAACRKIEADSGPVSQNIAIGDAYLVLNKKNEAAYMYRAAARINPNNIELQKKVGELMLTLGFINESIQQYQAVIKLNPGLVDESIKLAYLYAYKKDYVQSEYYLRIALANAPKRADIYLNLGLVLGAKGATLEAVNIYKQGLLLSPDNVRLKEELNRINSKTK